ncbi:hypothetical protein [Endozoicomonas sp. Mp262]|uniref:hypothetical protein n=1 Tax=Endozoicomonas sp. Mp262 TaxID=2919499 RepID=UPI0021D9CE66
MKLSPENTNRCDQKLCQCSTACNIFALVLALLFISGLAQATDFKMDIVCEKSAEMVVSESPVTD